MNRMELIAQRYNKQIFRRGPDAVKLWNEEVPAADVLSEALNQARAQEAGLPVPRLHEVTKLEGRWAILSDFIEGETLLQRIEAAPERLEEHLELFVQLQARVHAARAPKLPPQKDKLHRRISASGLDATTRYELHVRLEAMPQHEKVCHGDFMPSNVILQGEGNAPKAYIIDWAHVTQGNAAADAANTYVALLKCGREALAEAYLKLYCLRSDTALQYVRKWVPIIAGAHLARCKPEERAFYTGFCEGVAGEK